jgi:hypothetical protein
VYISYLDASGRASFKDSENYVLASLVVNERYWNYIDNKVKEIKLKHFPNLLDEDGEIHAKDIMNRDGIFNYLTWDEIYKIFDDVFNFISHISTDIVIHSSVIVKSKLCRKNLDVEIWAYRTLLERLNKFMEKENVKLIQSNFSHQYCILLTDSEDIRKDQKLRIRLIEMLRRGTFYSKLNYLFEEPMFVNSKLRNLSQLVDCVAYCIRKHFRTCAPSIHTTNWERYYALIEPKFDAPYGTYLG